MKSNVQTNLWLATCFVVFLGGIIPSYAMQPCPPRAETREKAQIVVEARLKSLFIGESGLLTSIEFAPRVVRAEFEIERVIKGKFSKKEVVAIGFIYAPGPFRELSLMAMLYGAGDGLDTFEWELSPQEFADDLSFYSLNDCVYYKFPESIEKLTGWEDNPSSPGMAFPLPAR
ncbi:hypothetical protein [Neorhizobium galegae]|uniref:hypothetical protein n=1 Tax=Neorhizobium galegae TaxID=399 RepID=UPI000621BBEC|nr:hypothetical protein [Neorhizobium galegae]CDZ31015.1 Hypothetical protein NGAL_HAMBI490_58880 [Neorhizobium galegae bv. officinalis]MCM2500977.1 hypothetical protein [Neorhizobium galegae]MCQ1771021.1 hypothetical protein [Neorhizobium galegae]MCQ1780116.1 hypothetical protein [Neorhizobium galegae]MCQ1793998.1 hypothetical protein [Neorhizobium galegae]